MKTKAEYYTFHETSTARSRKWITVESLWKNICGCAEGEGAAGMRWGEAASAVLRPLAFWSFERIGLSVQEF
jgi:hypothetical protein